MLKLAEKGSVRSGLVLSTCNRVEVYATGGSEGELISAAGEFLRQFHGFREEEVRDYLYSKTNRDAVRHLFRVREKRSVLSL